MTIRNLVAGSVAILSLVPLAGPAGAADLAPVYAPAPVLGAPVGVPLASAPLMYSPIRNWGSVPIQTHIIPQTARNPRTIGEGPVMGPAYPVIIVVKP